MGYILKGLYWEPQGGKPQEYSRNVIGICLPGYLFSIILLLYSWGALFGVPSKVPFIQAGASSLKLGCTAIVRNMVLGLVHIGNCQNYGPFWVP